MGEGNKKLSKRDPEAHLLAYRDQGFLPEGLLNYLALLGWAIAEDRDVFSLEEMVAAFDIGAREPQPRALRPEEGRGDQRRAHAAAEPRGDDRAGHAVPPGGRCARRPRDAGAGRAADPGDAVDPRADQQAHRGRRRCSASSSPTRSTTTRPTSPRCSTRTGCRSSPQPREALGALADWTTEAIDEALRAKLVDELGLKPRNAFGPVRVAVTGRRVSPPLFESLELLGREESLARLDAAPAAAGQG